MTKPTKYEFFKQCAFGFLTLFKPRKPRKQRKTSCMGMLEAHGMHYTELFTIERFFGAQKAAANIGYDPRNSVDLQFIAWRDIR